MSFGAQQAHSFFGPLKGKTVTFLVDDRQTNLSFAKSIISLATIAVGGCAIFDIDAFYSSNSDGILSALPSSAAGSTRVYVPEPGVRIETVLPRFFKIESGVFIVDSLNTLYHLFSSSGASSRSRKLAFAVTSLSYLARTNEKTVLLTMYRREKAVRTGGGRSISDLSDTSVSVEAAGSELLMRCKRGAAWPDGMLSLRIP
jgi:WD40 repeat protein